jgi:hypothetical protein
MHSLLFLHHAPVEHDVADVLAVGEVHLVADDRGALVVLLPQVVAPHAVTAVLHERLVRAVVEAHHPRPAARVAPASRRLGNDFALVRL